MAICGGVNSIISPETFIPLCRAKMMSATGQCQTFCDSADGYARGEGCGIVVLKKLSQVHVCRILTTQWNPLFLIFNL